MNNQKILTLLCLFLSCFMTTQVLANTPSFLLTPTSQNSIVLTQNRNHHQVLLADNSDLIRAQTLNQQGLEELTAGNMEAALATWQAAEMAYAKAGDRLGTIGSQINQAQAMQRLGLYLRSRRTLTAVVQALSSEPDSLIKAATLRSLGKTLQQIGDSDQSRLMLLESLEITRKLGKPEEISDNLIALGNTARNQADSDAAYAYYQEAAAVAQCPGGNHSCPSHINRLKAKINQLSLLIFDRKWANAVALVPEISSELAPIQPSHAGVYARIHFADSLIELNSANPANTPANTPANNPANNQDRYINHNYLNQAAEQLAKAIQEAKSINDQRAESYALGKLGYLYTQTEQFSAATQVTEQALLIAQSINAADIAYQWQWQLGRLLKNSGKKSGAIAIYTQAVNTLQLLRNDIVAIDSDVQFSFRESVEPVYRELVSQLLTAEPNQSDLKTALDVMELLQLAELDNFFQDACLDTKPVQIDQIDRNAAVIYPIILSDRLEVILSLPEKPLIHYSSAVSQTEVESILTELRTSLSPVVSRKKRLELSERVYDWLIRPIETELAASGVKTLVFVPDGAFRNVPMSTLYNGQQYLIEKYAIALTPGLQLLEPKSLGEIKLQALTAGLSESRQGFSPLPAVEFELNQIQSQLPTVMLLNQDFTRTKIQAKLDRGDFPVVHFATHGQFSSKADETFILTWDGEINVKELNEFLASTQTLGKNSQSKQRTPIELLVFSACETAAGDDRAALGLAGMAVRSGARSTIAALWAVKDEATALFMVEFYRILSSEPGISKAEALRQTQLTLLQNRQYQHPFYWSPFVLVGNWL
jgi:CHAT domain-containing protein